MYIRCVNDPGILDKSDKFDQHFTFVTFIAFFVLQK